MTDIEKLFWGGIITVVVGLLTALVIGLVRRTMVRRDDSLKLVGQLQVTCGIEVLRVIGCACLELTVSCLSQRAGKIAKAWIRVRGHEWVPAFERGFGHSMGTPAPNAPPPAMIVRLFPIPLRPDTESIVLTRDDAACFVLPIQIFVLPLFTTCPSENVSVGITLVDGTEIILCPGVAVQHQIRTLMELYGKEVQCLRVSPKFEIQLTSTTIPQPPPVGQRNPNPIKFAQHPPPMPNDRSSVL